MHVQAQIANTRMLVVSGGGCRGAWGAGLAKRLSEKHGVYNVAFGTSTGSLMIPLILLDRFEELETGYTTVTSKEIFDVNPFTKKGELNLLNALFRIVTGKATLGETNNLRKLIDRFLVDDYFGELRDKGKVFGIGVVDLKTGEKAIKLSTDFRSPVEIKNWIWASCNQPFLMTYYPSKKHRDPNPAVKGFFVDGGLRETVPLSDALKYAMNDSSVKNIDVIVNEPMRPVFNEHDNPTTILKSLKRTTDIWRSEVINNDVLLATQDSCSGPEKIHISIHYFPTQMYRDNANDLLFDSLRMTAMWNAGYHCVEDDPVNGPLKTEFDVCRKKLNEYFIKLENYTEKFRQLYSQ